MRFAATFLLLSLLGLIHAECPNACSGRGDCGAYNVCVCHRNFQGVDCSERTCPFGKAHVDSPKGDLDMSADSLTTSTILTGSQVYPYGTQEKFPEMTDSSGTELTETAHFYMECSSKGICDRDSGICECFAGYDGASCHRASCPNDCSGHGTCEHIETLAANDHGNVYALWDSDMTMGCACDPGFTGPDCAERICRYGIDPFYIGGQGQPARVQETHVSMTGNNGLSGTYAIKFYDVFGEDWDTRPITINTADPKVGNCSQVVSALEALPNTVIPSGTVVCSSATKGTGNTTYSLTFTGNPGLLKPLFIDTYLDDHRPTLSPIASEQKSTVMTSSVDVYNEGVSGAFMDYFATKCTGVEVTLTGSHITSTAAMYTSGGKEYSYEMNSGYYLDSLSDDESAIMKKCLGDSDGNDSYGNNVEIYDWDYGSYYVTGTGTTTSIESPSSHPHAIKLVSTSPADSYDSGRLYLTWYQSRANKFVLVNAPISDSASGSYHVYSTDGVVERVIVDTVSLGQIRSTHAGGSVSSQPPITAYFTQYSNVLYTSYDTACETADALVEPCLDKGDMLFVLDSTYLRGNQNVSNAGNTVGAPEYAADSGNLYTIKKIYKADPTKHTFNNGGYEDRFRIVLDSNVPFAGTTTATATTGFGKATGNNNVGIVGLFKFTPATTGNYEYVSQCSGRGACIEGVCECFHGYTSENCGIQSAHAL